MVHLLRDKHCINAKNSNYQARTFLILSVIPCVTIQYWLFGFFIIATSMLQNSEIASVDERTKNMEFISHVSKNKENRKKSS